MSKTNKEIKSVKIDSIKLKNPFFEDTPWVNQAQIEKFQIREWFMSKCYAEWSWSYTNSSYITFSTYDTNYSSMSATAWVITIPKSWLYKIFGSISYNDADTKTITSIVWNSTYDKFTTYNTWWSFEHKFYNELELEEWEEIKYQVETNLASILVNEATMTIEKLDK